MIKKRNLVVHHGGYWRKIQKLEYVGGKVSIFDDLHDSIDFSHINSLVASLGYTNVSKMHYKDPRKDTLDTGLKFLSDENSIFVPFVSSLIEYGEIYLYLEHEFDSDHRDLDCLNVNIPFMCLFNCYR
ncbi:hypothetical protein BVRB_4g088980 [Beta vulgaris subsp. vulgaris]|nr:hypothetical protein BVRB_4g088980 [Beta vulgaris subsp. vulgaris]